jgi:hypothetical protein
MSAKSYEDLSFAPHLQPRDSLRSADISQVAHQVNGLLGGLGGHGSEQSSARQRRGLAAGGSRLFYKDLVVHPHLR